MDHSVAVWANGSQMLRRIYGVLRSDLGERDQVVDMHHLRCERTVHLRETSFTDYTDGSPMSEARVTRADFVRIC